MLRALVLTLHHHAGRQVGDANSGVGLVDVLAAGAGGAIGVDAQICRIDLVVGDFICFRQHGHRAGRGVDAALRLGGRHALHPVRAGFELQQRVGPVADDSRDDFLVAAQLAVAAAQDFYLPAAALGVFAVHAEKVRGKQRGLIAPGPGAYLKKDVGVVGRVAGQQQDVDILFQRSEALAAAGQFVIGHCAQFGVFVLLHGQRLRAGGFDSPEVTKGAHQRVNFGAFPRQGTKAVLHPDDFRGSQQGINFFAALGQLFQPAQQ